MVKRLFIATLVAIGPLVAFAQNVITGHITDVRTGESLIGASVIVKSEKGQGVVTDIDGNFSLTTKKEAPLTLRVEYVGYRPLDVDVYDFEEPVEIALAENSNALSEIVVVGYGTQSRKEFTGSISSILGSDVNERPIQSFEQALAGKAAGVSLAASSGQLNAQSVIRIRGVNSISLSSLPLFVIDGVPLYSDDISTNSASNNPLSDINPSDIESIDILKDAASTAIYGSRAAGGVILVTTKKGHAGRVSTHYNGWISFTNAVRLPKMLNAQQYTDLKNEAITNANLIDGGNRALTYQIQKLSDGSIVDTNWKDYVYRTGISHNHTIDISGGNDRLSYYFSANYSNQEGLFKGNNFERKGIRFNAEDKVTNWLTLTLNSNYSTSFNESPDTGSRPGSSMSSYGVTRLALVLPPNVSAYNEDGTYNVNPISGTLGSGENKTSFPLYNPAARLDLTNSISKNSHFIGDIKFQIKPIRQITWTGQYSLDRINNQSYSFSSIQLGSGATSSGGSVSNISREYQNEDFNTTLKFEDLFGKIHNIGVLIGFDYQHNVTNFWGARATNESDEFFRNYQGGWANISATGNQIGERNYVSYFVRGNYTLKDRYYLTANFRRDGNSALAKGHKFGSFGGISAGWMISEESFFKKAISKNTINHLKLNASWGRVGNGNITNDFSSYSLYTSSLYGDASTWINSQQGNDNLSWETSSQTNIGISIDALNNKLHIEAAYFNNNVDNLILSVPQSPSKGIVGNSILANVGSMYNRGIEVSIGYDVLSKKDWNWYVSGNFTYLKNKVTSLSGNEDAIISSTGSGTTNITKVGYSVGSLYGLKTLRVNPENGQRVFLNGAGEEVQYNGLGKWTYLDGSPAAALGGSDYYLLGNALPRWYGGIVSNLSWKGVELNLNFTYAGGNKIMNRSKSTITDQIFFNNSTEILNRWTEPGQETNIPRLVTGDRYSFGGSVPISEHVEKGDFLRLQDITLAYSLPKNILAKIKSINNVRIYGQITNAFIITGYSGVDPELSANGNSNTTPGVDYNTGGYGRTFTFGINIAL
ncbi:TonB-dependent receptor [Prevotella sp. P6B1]|uniref:SusC/RagA family TonB-linked outer membrane protein n=1 Tax=Prevotella sp. P6B1 TaxID=1410613 RepID=UPI00051B4C07|nr:TonB-dependent receptor [Prevotella sp. P6B1]